MFGRRKVRQVDFVVAGAQKCGTTALHYFISKHPHIAVPRDQALHFFDKEENFATGQPNYELLYANFDRGRRWKIAGEVTSDYIYWPAAMERLARYNPRMKIIASLRNPVSRAFSHWNMRRQKNQEPLDFIDAINRDKNEVREPFSRAFQRYGYVDRSIYAPQLERMFRFFPREQLLILKYEDFRADYRRTVDSVFDFLGVERLPKIPNRERNTASYQRRITQEERDYVAPLFAEDIARVQGLLAWNCGDWRPSAMPAR